MLGISIYPEIAKEKEIFDYLELAAKYNFKRVFANLLEIKGSKADVEKKFHKIIHKARELKMEFILDVSQRVFETLKIEPKDLSFFHKIGATGIRLDDIWDPRHEAEMTHNPYDLKIEINMSMSPTRLENLLSFAANKNNLIGCHNFYPMEFSGLNLDFFVETSLIYRENNIRSAAFVNSQSAKLGPWSVMDGLPTLEIHRNLPIDTQVKHFYMMDLVDDIIIGNMFASEAELKAIAKLPSYPTFKIKEVGKLPEIEKKILYDEDHVYRGDISDVFIRSTWPRITYKGKEIKPNNAFDILEFGDVCIPNNNYEHYRGEINIIKENIPNNLQRRNVVAKIIPEESFLLNFLAPWSKFKFKKIK